MIRFAIALTGTALISLAAGCSLHRPQPTPLPVDVPEDFSSPTEPGSVPLDRWWTAFDDEGLNALMNEAFSANLDLDQAVARLQQLTGRRIDEDTMRGVRTVDDLVRILATQLEDQASVP